MKKILLYISYNFLAVLALFFIAELIVRVFYPSIPFMGTDKRLYLEKKYGESSGLRPLSSGLSAGAAVKVDEYGFRMTSSAIDTVKESWLLIGDSVTMGIGVEADSIFAGIMQSNLRNLNILNPSMIGYNVNDYVNLIDFFLILNPDIFKIRRVTLFWCLNDIYTDSDVIRIPGEKIRSKLGFLLNAVRAKSKTYTLLKRALYDRPKSYWLFDSNLYSDGAKVDSCIRKIDSINDMCKKRKIAFDMVLMPYEYQLRVNQSEAAQPQEIMEKKLKPLRIAVLNPTQYVKNKNINSRKLFLFGDGIHLSKSGHGIIGRYLLRQNSIVAAPKAMIESPVCWRFSQALGAAPTGWIPRRLRRP